MKKNEQAACDHGWIPGGSVKVRQSIKSINQSAWTTIKHRSPDATHVSNIAAPSHSRPLPIAQARDRKTMTRQSPINTTRRNVWTPHINSPTVHSSPSALHALVEEEVRYAVLTPWAPHHLFLRHLRDLGVIVVAPLAHGVADEGRVMPTCKRAPMVHSYTDTRFRIAATDSQEGDGSDI